jgi:hypothetical protein
MSGQHVCAKVAGQDQATFPFGKRGIEMLAASHLENRSGFIIGRSIEQQVSGAPKDMIPGEFSAGLFEIPAATEDLSTSGDGAIERFPKIRLQAVFQTTNPGNQACRRLEREEPEQR